MPPKPAQRSIKPETAEYAPIVAGKVKVAELG
jgi:hypothetical protein